MELLMEVMNMKFTFCLMALTASVFTVSNSASEPVKLVLYKTPLLVNKAILESGGIYNLIHAQKNNLEGKPGQGYYISVLLGTPPQSLNVLVDTGSSNFAVAAAKNVDIAKYFHSDRSSTFRDEGTGVFVPYTQGNWKGQLGNDIVSLPSLPNHTFRADLVAIDSSEKFFINDSNWQGILGLAYVAIARPNDGVVPFFDAFTKRTGGANVFSMQLCGSVIDKGVADDVEMGGTMILGGINGDLFTEPILYSPIYKEWYYEIIIADILVNEQSLNMDCKEYNFDKTIVDSGTTNLRLPQKVFDRLVTMLKAGTNLSDPPPASFWSGLEMLCWPKQMSSLDLFPDVKLALLMADNQTFNLVISPQQYIRTIGDHLSRVNNPGKDCFKFAIASSTTGTVIGAVVMEGFYVIFDRENKTIGWAETRCSDSRPSNLRVSRLEGPHNANVPVSLCAYVKTKPNQKTLTVVAYVMAGVCGLCVLPVLIALIHWRLARWRQRTLLDVDGGLLINAVTT